MPFTFMATAIRRGFDDPRWMTYRQANQNGRQVRPGERLRLSFGKFKTAHGNRDDSANGKDNEKN